MNPVLVWKRVSERYSVEIRVGDTWVVHESHDTLSAAEVGAQKIATDPSVHAARVCALKTAQSYMIVSEAAKPLVSATPKGFTATGARVACRSCGAPDQRVVVDNSPQEWVFCTTCKRAYPC